MLPRRQCIWELRRLGVHRQIPWHCRYSSTKAATHTAPPPLAQIHLRPYQEETIQALLNYYESGGKRAGISLATGGGKTVVFTQLIERIPPRKDNGTQTLILAHRQELVDQAYRHCKLAHPHKSVEIELGKAHSSGAADITIASMQSINSKDRIQKFDASRFKLVIVDEAHHIVAPSYLKILEHFDLRRLTKHSPVLAGFSATLNRADGLALGSVLDHIVYHKDYVEMIREKWLSDAIFTTVGLKADLSKVRTTAGDFQTAALSDAVNTPENNEATFLAWHERASTRKSTLVFCVDVRHITDLTATFRRHGIEARYVTGETPARFRSDTLDAFKNLQFPVLLNCGVFTEGTDIPNIDCVLLARPTKSQNLLIQMIGRGLRLYPGKDNCHIIDMVSSLKSGVVTTPTLFGLDPDEAVEGANSEELEDLHKRKEEAEKIAKVSMHDASYLKGNFVGTMTFTDYDSVEDLLADRAGDQHIRALSQYAWVQVGEERYILTTMTGNYITLTKTDNHYLATYTERLPSSTSTAQKSPYMRPRTIARGITLQDAIHSADTYAKKVFPHVFISKHQSWRNAEASEKQVEALNKTRDKAHQLKAGDITKGVAIDMITKLKFGAKGRVDKMSAERQKAVRGQETLERKLKSLQSPKLEIWNKKANEDDIGPTPLENKLKELWGR